MTAAIEPVVGRYIRLEIDGRPHRLYWEEAGEGIPLLCLHTAGSDGRQFRGLLNDSAVTDHFRVVAYDMPWHGKSSPPPGWRDGDGYRLTTEGYQHQILAVSEALGLDRPVCMGCSIGGRIVLHLALNHPTAFRALIGLQAAAHIDPYYDIAWLGRPDVGNEVNAAYISGLFDPEAPHDDRWETLWHYMQGGPGVFRGDLHFYKFDGDVRDRLDAIDTAACPLYLLTGEYDFSGSPADTKVVADSVPGADFKVMPGLGHFPMSENYPRFREHLLPVLEQIRQAEAI